MPEPVELPLEKSVREMLSSDGLTFGQNDGTFDNVSQLADVAWISVARQRGQHLIREPNVWIFEL